MNFTASGTEPTWIYAVQLHATVQAAPPQIVLQWEPDEYGATSYTVYRKSKESGSWGTGTVLPGSASSFVDVNVVAGASYEYQVVKQAALGYTGFGYIHAGIEAPLIDQRGTLILIVATNSAIGLESELERLKRDLIGDGWRVVRRDVSSNDTPANVRNIITGIYYSDPGNVRSLFLFGHVPVKQSGNIDYDGHLERPMPADSYYGDIDGDWSGNPGFLPSDVELMVGRVDMFNMRGVGASPAWPGETELLRNYLNKNHSWRHGNISVPRRALIGDRRGTEEGEATASSGFRNFAPLVGAANVVRANTDDNSPVATRWISLLATNRYLWTYGCGGGMQSGISHLGVRGQYNEVWSIDIVGRDAQAVFAMFFGSWFGNWDGQDNFLRSILATPTLGLAAAMAGRPHWFCHHMALGETIGYSARLSMNNSLLYRNHSNEMARAVYVSLMGDPTLRMHPVAPPSGLSAIPGPDAVTLQWTASPEPVAGYHVYRAGSIDEPFTRLTGSLVTGTTFIDTSGPGSSIYMVRAVKLESTPSGTYFNSSQGVFAGTAIRLHASFNGTNVVLTWNSHSGETYRVQTKTTADSGTWTPVSGPITATGPTTSWADTATPSSERLYRIIRE